MKTPLIKERLPYEVVKKLRENAGGGTHKSPKQYNRKREKAQVRSEVNKYR